MDDFTAGLNKAIDEKIEEIESPGYEGVPKFTKSSWIAALSMIVICVITIVIRYSMI